jgi:hypothetical protein
MVVFWDVATCSVVEMDVPPDSLNKVHEDFGTAIRISMLHLELRILRFILSAYIILQIVLNQHKAEFPSLFLQ